MQSLGKKVAWALAVGAVVSVGYGVKAVQAAPGASTSGSKQVVLQNEYLARSFSYDDGIWKTTSIENKRIGKSFEPNESSHEFLIHLLPNEKAKDPNDTTRDIALHPVEVLDRSKWQADLSVANGTKYPASEVAKLFDGKANTHVDTWTISGNPISLVINLGSSQTVESFSVMKRPGYSDANYGKNGTPGKYKLYVSNDGSTWMPAGSGEFTAEDYHLHTIGNLHNVGDVVFGNFDKPYTTQYVKIETLSDALGSTQEFTAAEINLYGDKNASGKLADPADAYKPSKEWSATLGGNNAAAVIDGDDATTVSGNVGNEIVIDMGKSQPVGAFGYMKRPGYNDANYGKNGTMGAYKVYVSEDKSDWKLVASSVFNSADYQLHEVTLKQDQISDGTTHKAGTKLFNVGNMVYANFGKDYTARYVKIVPESDVLGGSNEFVAAEFKLFSHQIAAPKAQVTEDTTITPDVLKVANVDAQKDSVRVQFAPYNTGDANVTITGVYNLSPDKHYMQSHLEISSDYPERVRIDYIDFDNFVLPKDVEGVWSIPQEKDVSSMWIGKHELMLGQPIYAQGLFFGSEFPAQDTSILPDSNTMCIRYYSGKSLAQMKEDHQHVVDGTFHTWNNVVGAAQGVDPAVVQTDFFSYISDIATPTAFRKQYNSWYDNMMDINDASIKASFLGAEKGLTQNGVAPLDSYVVDDGWNNYNNQFAGVWAPGASGTTYNKTGFWEFNNKFPNELYTSTALTDKFHSTFGMWLGPQGGYNYFTGFAKYLNECGTADVQNNSALGTVIDTGSRLYLNNLENRMIDYQKRFNIDYWKLDGFASRPSNSQNAHHMTGGYKNMYFTSDMWEAWTRVFTNMRNARAQEGKGLFINATCYVNLSPWMLQWTNAIWVQDSGDTGEAGPAQAARHQRKIYYRDNVYYNLLKKNQVQFPLKNIYNHDPIYGVSDSSNATTDVFREYLMDNAMRGTAFWELYFSPSIMNEEKWQVVADVLQFAEENHGALSKAKLFVEEGKNPTNGVYGYSAWDSDRGFVSFVNPTAQTKHYSLTLNNVVGVPTSMSNFKELQILPYEKAASGKSVSYGDTLEVDIPAFSSKILQYGIVDTTAPTMRAARIAEDGKVHIAFNERMNEDAKFTVDGKTVKATLAPDYHTFILDTALDKDSAVLGATTVKDVAGNTTSIAEQTVRTAGRIAQMTPEMNPVPFKVQERSAGSEALIAGTKTAFNLQKDSVELTKSGISGTHDFSISGAFATVSANAPLVTQGSDIKLSIDADGYLVFNVGDQQVSSKEVKTVVDKPESGRFGTNEYSPTKTKEVTKGIVNDGKLHSFNAVREPNGMIKLYIDGELASSVYDAKAAPANITEAPVTLGSDALSAYVGDIAVYNSAQPFDKAKAAADDLGISSDTKALPKDGWTAKACSEQSPDVAPGIDGGAASVLDNNPNTFWHTNYVGGDTCDPVHNLTVMFGKPTTFDNLEYVARRGGGNGTWTKAKVLGIAVDDEGEHTEVIADVDPIELKDGKYVFAFDTPQTFDGVRFEFEGVGGFGSAAEINATQNMHAADAKQLLGLQDDAHSKFAPIDKKSVSEARMPKYEALNKAYAQLVNLPITTNDKVSTAAHDAFNDALALFNASANDTDTTGGEIKPDDPTTTPEDPNTGTTTTDDTTKTEPGEEGSAQIDGTPTTPENASAKESTSQKTNKAKLAATSDEMNPQLALLVGLGAAISIVGAVALKKAHRL